MKIEAADSAGGSELTITIVTSKASAALATLAEHLAPLVASIAVQIAPVERDEPGVPAELVDPDVDVVGLPSPEDDVDAPAEPEAAAPTVVSGEPGDGTSVPRQSHSEADPLTLLSFAFPPPPRPWNDPAEVEDQTRAEADELIAAGLSAHHIANELGVDLENVRRWQREAR